MNKALMTARLVTQLGASAPNETNGRSDDTLYVTLTHAGRSSYFLFAYGRRRSARSEEPF